MKTSLKFLAAAAALSLTGSLFLTGCPEEGCTLNSDCDDGQICNADTNLCEVPGAACAANADCDTAGGLFCVQSADNSGASVCGEPVSCDQIAVEGERGGYCDSLVAGELCLTDVGDDTVLACRAAADCSESTDVSAFCRNAAGQTGGEMYTCDVTTDPATPTCVEEVETDHFNVMILDDSPSACTSAEDTNDFDPGVDITFVELSDASGATLGWGETVSYTPKRADGETKEIAFGRQEVLDGMAPTLLTTVDADKQVTQQDIDNRCPAGDANTNERFTEVNVLTLGCGGNVIVDFPSGTSMQPIYDGYKVSVGEYAAICNQNEGSAADVMGTSDRYEVYVCPAVAAGADAQTDIECQMGEKISDMPYGGYKEFTVSGVKSVPAADDTDS